MNAEYRVLIIDSDLNNCKAIKYALNEYGIGAYYTLSVIDGIEHLTHHNYELVLLDISLSETDGLQLLRFMRQMRNMPILVLSFQGSIEHIFSHFALYHCQEPLNKIDRLLNEQSRFWGRVTILCSIKHVNTDIAIFPLRTHAFFVIRQ